MHRTLFQKANNQIKDNWWSILREGGGGIIVTKKNLVIAVLTTLCLTSVLFTALPIRSASMEWDSWADVSGTDPGKQDGTVNMKDIAWEVLHFNTKGPPYIDRELINVTQSQIDGLSLRIDNLNASLIDLRSEVESMNVTNLMPLLDSLNASLIGLGSDVVNMNDTLNLEISKLDVNVTELQSKLDTLNSTLSSRINSLETQIATMNATITGMNTTITQLQDSNAELNDRINGLEGNFSLMLSRLDALEANYSVTNLRLAPYAIPFNVTYSNQHSWTTETSGFVDMPYTSVTLSLNRTSQLLILFSSNAWVSSASYNPGTYIICQATVNGTAATPNAVELTPTMNAELGGFDTHAHRIINCTCSFNFYTGLLNAGSHTIQIRWYLSATGQGDVQSRTLEVIALPV